MSESVQEHKAASARSLALAIVTVSDTRTLETDVSGQILADKSTETGHTVLWRMIVRDEPSELNMAVERAESDPSLQVLLMTGGTGISHRDVTVDTIQKRFTRDIPGFGELFRMLSYQEIGSACILSRSTAGMIGRLVVVLLPGSRAAVQLAMEKILIPELPHLVREAHR